MTAKKGGRRSEGDVGIHSQREEVKPASEGLADNQEQML